MTDAPDTLRTGDWWDLRIHVTQNHQFATDPAFGKWRAQANRGERSVQHGYGATELEAVEELLRLLRDVGEVP